MEAAAQEKGDLKVLAVTALTSLDRGDLDDLGFACDVRELVLSRAKRALQIGCDGIVSSGLEVAMLRTELDHKLLVITPGIRPVDNREEDDQKRVVSVEMAFQNGADYIVVGRPIRKAVDPVHKAEEIVNEITEGLAPVIVQKLGEVVTKLRNKGFTIVLVEQNFRFAAGLADRHYVVEGGLIVEVVERSELKAKAELLNGYLGV